MTIKLLSERGLIIKQLGVVIHVHQLRRSFHLTHKGDKIFNIYTVKKVITIFDVMFRSKMKGEEIVVAKYTVPKHV